MRVLVLCPKRLLPVFSRHLPPAACHVRHPGGKWDILIRWGVTDGPDAPYTLNPLWALRQLSQPGAVGSLLRSNGIPQQGPGRRKARPPVPAGNRVTVHMVDLHPIAVRRRRAHSGGIHPKVTRESFVHLARRTLYATGLHFGAVELAWNHTGRPHVVRVDPAPMPADEALLELYAEAIGETVRLLCADAVEPSADRFARITLGADPEFVLRRRDSGDLRFASDFFPQHGTVGFDQQSVTVQGRIHHPVAEIRPRPSVSPLALVHNVRTELYRARRMAADLNTAWLAGSHPYPGLSTGGHIHFSGLHPCTFFLRALDNYLAVPSLLLEDPERARRRRPRHGRLGEIRLKEHGGFEYRTLGSWLGSMRRAAFSLCLAKLIAIEFPRLRRHLLDSPESHVAFYRGDKDFFRPRLSELWHDLEQTDSYALWRQELDRVRIWIHNRRTWNEDIDLKRLWRIR